MLGRILAATWRILVATLTIPLDFIRWLTGSGAGAPLPPGTAFEEAAGEEAGRLREELNAPAHPRDAGTAARTLGGLVHAYASGDRQARDSFDFGRVPEHVAVALLAMRPADLTKLAGAAPEACGRWALGERSGIVGLPLCRKPLPTVSGKRSDGVRKAVLALVPAGESPCMLLPRAA